MRKRITTVVLIVILLTGLSLLLYPSVSDYWNSLHQSRAVISYAEDVANIDDAEYDKLWSEAVSYNQELAISGMLWNMTDEETARYEATLNVGASGMMSYIEIPKIGCSLPVYHGTDETVIQTSVGHIPGSSLPVGGESTHCILSSHRGLPSARLFTDLDKLEEGDQFVIRTLDEVLTYEVDQIRVVEPVDLSSLQIVEGMDYCTLVTCTPYGINTHRLLVRGRRVETVNTTETRVTADAIQIDTAVVAPFVAAPIILLLLVFLLIDTGKRRSRSRPAEHSDIERHGSGNSRRRRRWRLNGNRR